MPTATEIADAPLPATGGESVSSQSLIKPQLIVPFVNSVRQVFGKMVGVRINIQRPHVKRIPVPSYDVSGIIGFSGEILGSVVLSFQQESARRIVAAFAGMNLDLSDPDFADAIGELANMVVGSAKKDLNALASITVPNVVIGPGHVIARLSDVPCVVLPCATTMGDFAVEINIKPNKAMK